MTLAFEDELGCDVSVVVPTYNRRSILRRTLESLVAQRASAVRYEVLVVDNNSSDDTREMVEVFSREHPRIRYLFEPRQGVSHARNTGIAAARAPLLAFIDDDVEAGPTWVAAIKQAFDVHPEIDCLGGRIEPRWAAPPPPWLTPMFWAAVALQAGKGDSRYIDADHASPCLMTANFACRRTALQQVGGFSVAYLRDEDRELQLRLWAAGKRGMYVDEVAVTTEVPLDRLTKSYHRQFYARVGQSHARMRYLDRIDVAGRLLREIPPRVTLLGTPAFIYRQMLFHVARLVWTTATLQRHRAFFHQTRVLYFVSYVRRRQREERHSLWALPRELSRLLTTLLQRPLRRGVAQSLSARRPTSGEAAALPEQTLRT